MTTPQWYVDQVDQIRLARQAIAVVAADQRRADRHEAFIRAILFFRRFRLPRLPVPARKSGSRDHASIAR
jgi:hypothetical protein